MLARHVLRNGTIQRKELPHVKLSGKEEQEAQGSSDILLSVAKFDSATDVPIMPIYPGGLQTGSPAPTLLSL